MYSVVVQPERWTGPLDALAQLMAPDLRLPVAQVQAMLVRGAVTVDADLLENEARALCERLTRRNIPAQVLDLAGVPVGGAPASLASGADWGCPGSCD